MICLSGTVVYALLALLLALLVYASVYLYNLYYSYLVFRLYSSSPSVRRELRSSDVVRGRIPAFLYPGYPRVLLRRILELEEMYDFVEELGLDLSSIRRDYFAMIRGELGSVAGVVEVEDGKR